MQDFLFSYCSCQKTEFVRQKEPWPGTERYFTTNYALYYCPECTLFFSAPVNFEVLNGIQRYFLEQYNNADRDCHYAQMVEGVWRNFPEKHFLGISKPTLRRLKWRLLNIEPNFGEGRAAEALGLLYAHGTRTLLDVGCSFGDFVKVANQIGIESYGLDPSRDVVRLIAARGIENIDEGFFPESKGRLSRYDALTFIQVLFQFDNLSGEFFRACREVLNPGGVLLVFCTDPRHIGQADIEPVVRSPVALNFTGESFMRRVSRDAGFTDYRYIPCKAEPKCCFHFLVA